MRSEMAITGRAGLAFCLLMMGIFPSYGQEAARADPAAGAAADPEVQPDLSLAPSVEVGSTLSEALANVRQGFSDLGVTEADPRGLLENLDVLAEAVESGELDGGGGTSEALDALFAENGSLKVTDSALESFVMRLENVGSEMVVRDAERVSTGNDSVEQALGDADLSRLSGRAVAEGAVGRMKAAEGLLSTMGEYLKVLDGIRDLRVESYLANTKRYIKVVESRIELIMASLPDFRATLVPAVIDVKRSNGTVPVMVSFVGKGSGSISWRLQGGRDRVRKMVKVDGSNCHGSFWAGSSCVIVVKWQGASVSEMRNLVLLLNVKSESKGMKQAYSLGFSADARGLSSGDDYVAFSGDGEEPGTPDIRVVSVGEIGGMPRVNLLLILGGSRHQVQVSPGDSVGADWFFRGLDHARNEVVLVRRALGSGEVIGKKSVAYKGF